MVITAVILGALVGTIVFAIGFISTTGRWFASVGIVFLLITLAAPLNLAMSHAADGQTVATLILLHVAAGGSIIGLLSRLGRRRPELASDGAGSMPS